MPLVFLDTNVIMRFLTRDDLLLAARARAIFEQAARGDFTLYVSEGVIVDVSYVLTSKNLYKLPRPDAVAALRGLLSLQGLRIPQKQTYQRALDLWSTATQGVDFTDALLVAQMERMKVSTIASFDGDSDRFPQITRLGT